MKIGDYTGVEDVEKLYEMICDDSLNEQTRLLAVVDLSLTRDFDWHRLLDFVLDTRQPASIRGEIFDKQDWDTRGIPVIVEALQEDNDEIQFWSAFALLSACPYWQPSDLIDIFTRLDTVAQNDNILPGWWYVGREALAALELAFLMRAGFTELQSINRMTYLISPRLEYHDLVLAKIEIQRDVKLRVEPDWLQEQIRLRFKSSKFGVRRPQIEAYLLDWKIGYGTYSLWGALHRDGFGIVLTGMDTSVRRFAEWYRTIISDDYELRLYDWAGGGEIL